MNNLFNYFIKNRSENFLDKVLPQVYPRINTGHVCRREIQWVDRREFQWNDK